MPVKLPRRRYGSPLHGLLTIWHRLSVLSVKLSGRRHGHSLHGLSHGRLSVLSAKLPRRRYGSPLHRLSHRRLAVLHGLAHRDRLFLHGLLLHGLSHRNRLFLHRLLLCHLFCCLCNLGIPITTALAHTVFCYRSALGAKIEFSVLRHVSSHSAVFRLILFLCHPVPISNTAVVPTPFLRHFS